MADILIVGTSPKSDEGKEYFLHCLDWWWDILFVINRLLKDRFPVDAYFIREFPLAAPAPVMEEEECQECSKLLQDVLQDGSARSCLMTRYRDDPVLYDYYGNDENLKNRNLDERLEQLEQFARFLDSCGGCRVKWYMPE